MRDKQSSEKNEFPSECSRQHVECRLDTIAGILSSYIRELGPHIPKKVKKYIFHQLFSKESSGHLKCSFEYTAKTFFDKNPKISFENSKKKLP